MATLLSTETGASEPAERPADGLPRLLVGIVASVALADAVWAAAAHFDIDLASYAELALLALALGIGSLFYARVRRSRGLAAMLFGTAFLVSFSAVFSLLNYFLLTIAGSRIDSLLAKFDTALGVDWPALMAFVAAHPHFNLLLHIAYITVLPQVALLVLCLGWREKTFHIHQFCLALAIGAAITIAFWTLFPSFGAFSVYGLPSEVSSRLNPELDSHYARELIGLLAHGPGRISPHDVKGLIGFPSYHAAMAVLVVWHARSIRWVRWPLLAWNAVVLVATPVHGGHFVVDVIAGVAVAVASVALTTAIARRSMRGVLQHVPTHEVFPELPLPELLAPQASADRSAL